MSGWDKKTYDEKSIREYKNLWLQDDSKNPFTGKKIGKNGKVYKTVQKILEEVSDDVPKSPTPRVSPKSSASRVSPKICEEWNSGPKDINPETGRKIKKGGPKFKELEKLCSEKIRRSRSVSPKSPTPRVSPKSPTPRVSPKSPTPRVSPKICEEWNSGPKDINPETGRKIKKGGPKFKELEKLCSDFKKKLSVKASSVSVPPVIEVDGKAFVESANSKSRFDLFSKLARDNGYIAVDVPGDGNCMLTAVGSYFGMNGSDLRKYLTEYISKCDVKSPFFNFGPEFVSKLTKDGEWCDEQTATLITIALDCTLNILNELSRSFQIIGNNKSRIVTIGYMYNYHYVILIRIGESQPSYVFPAFSKCASDEEIVSPVTSNRPEITTPAEIQKLIDNMYNVRNKNKISTMIASERTLLKSVGLI